MGSPTEHIYCFLISVSTLPGVKAFFEPYIVPYYRNYPLSDPIPFTDLNHSFEEATKMIQGDYPGKTAVFVKDFSFAVAGRFESFLGANFTHSFLIRNPKRVIMSYYRLLGGDPELLTELRLRDDLGFVESHDFYFFLRDHLNIDPVIIDADDLLANPEKMMESYCKRVGLTYQQGMTKWDPGSGWDPNFKDQLLFAGGSDWGDVAVESSGFKELPPLPTVPHDIPSQFTECMEECFKPYNELYSLRMTV